ncbi:coiled-coil domain-containing protein 97-like [Aphelocoma coerulescens]|uniref:coiled-coil domain-containing protein 97-like n=1 Tax=Aphelocoma coerulescens TaxID=39617 RepID=UPI0036046734
MAANSPKTPEPSPKSFEEAPKIWGEAEFPRGGPQNPSRGAPTPPARTRLRNRRFAALRELLKGGEYFSEEQMRLRAPGLFHHYIGRFRDPKSAPGPPKSAPGPPQKPWELLLSSLQEAALGDCPEEEEEEEEEEDEDEDEDEERIPDEAERELLRLEFTSRMYQSFLEGQDSDFDYSQVDENPELDNLDILSRDLGEQNPPKTPNPPQKNPKNPSK